MLIAVYQKNDKYVSYMFLSPRPQTVTHEVLKAVLTSEEGVKD